MLEASLVKVERNAQLSRADVLRAAMLRAGPARRDHAFPPQRQARQPHPQPQHHQHAALPTSSSRCCSFSTSPARGIIITAGRGGPKTTRHHLDRTARARGRAPPAGGVSGDAAREVADGLQNRFGVKAEIADARGSCFRACRRRAKPHEEFALIASMRGCARQRAGTTATSRRTHRRRSWPAGDDGQDALLPGDRRRSTSRNAETQTHRFRSAAAAAADGLVLWAATPVRCPQHRPVQTCTCWTKTPFRTSGPTTGPVQANAPSCRAARRVLRRTGDACRLRMSSGRRWSSAF